MTEKKLTSNLVRGGVLGAVVAGLVACVGSARGQARPTATGPGSYVSAGGGVSAFQQDYGQRKIGGFAALVDVHPTWRFGVEAEGRWLRYHTEEDVTQSNYLIGPRVVLLPGHWRPYAKFLAGQARMEFPFKYATGSFFAYAPGGGVEYVLGDRVAVRIADVEYQVWPQFPYGALHPYGVTTGITIRLNGLGQKPRGLHHR